MISIIVKVLICEEIAPINKLYYQQNHIIPTFEKIRKIYLDSDAYT